MKGNFLGYIWKERSGEEFDLEKWRLIRHGNEGRIALREPQKITEQRKEKTEPKRKIKGHRSISQTYH